MIRIYLLKSAILYMVGWALYAIATKAGIHAGLQEELATDLAKDKVQKRIDSLEAEAKYAAGVVEHWAGVAVDKMSEACDLRDNFDAEVDKLLG